MTDTTDPTDAQHTTRRAVLRAVTAGTAAVAVAGCSGDGSGESDGGGSSGDGSGDGGVLGSGGDGSGGTGGATSGGSTGGTATFQEPPCPFGDGTERFDASGTPFVFHFEYDAGYKEPNLWDNQINLEVDANSFSVATHVIRQEDPSVTADEPSFDAMMEEEPWEVVAETTFGGETVQAITIPGEQAPVKVRLPHSKGGENGVEVDLLFYCGQTTGCVCDSEANRESMLQTLESFEPNPDSTL